MTTVSYLLKEKPMNMKKLVIALLTLVGLAALVSFIAKHLND
jgi:hypothetical protein